MKATEAKLLEVVRKAPQFVIPIYQRTYSWTEKECRQLWEDIIRAGRDEGTDVHFLGSVVYVEDGLSNQTDRRPLLVIDGQQRLTTATILLATLRDALGNGEEPTDGFSARKIENRYLRDPDEDGERSYKLILTQADKDTLIAVVRGKSPPEEVSNIIVRNHGLFTEWVAGLEDPTDLCRGLQKLIVVEIALNRDHDNPQLIFESMNSTGLKLSQADLIRNYVLMGLPPSEQVRLYEECWRPMEKAFGQEAYSAQFDGFMRHFLTYRTGTIPRIGDVYEAFKAYSRRTDVAVEGIETLLQDMRDHARYFCRMATSRGSEREADRRLREAFEDLHELRVDTAFPLLLELYGDYERGVLSRDDFLAAVRLVEAYVFRRVACAIPTNTLNTTFAGFGRHLRKERYLESMQAHLQSQRTYRRFPKDDEFKRELKTRDLYNMRQRAFWLRRFENHRRKERVPVEDYTIEHIMPQASGGLSEVWKKELGKDWARIHETWLHTLGNLTLSGYNSEYGDRPFAKKRDMEGGLRDSPLRLNKGIGKVEHWDEKAIAERAKQLAEEAVLVWPAPSLDKSILATYRTEVETGTGYTIDDHPNLAGGAVRELFEILRREIQALDADVVEEFTKLYIAYKAETNFVDVTARSTELRCTFNLPFADLVDPRGLCRDVSNVGKWGNGDVELKVSRLEQVAYAVGIAGQALQRQIGGPEETIA